MRSAQQWLDLYGVSHQHPSNKVIHWICVPVIYWTVLAFLWSVPTAFLGEVASWLNWAVVAVIVVQAYYFVLSWRLALGMLVINIGLLLFTDWLASVSPWPVWQVALVAFVLAWIGQFVGHKIEGKKPSFFNDLQFLMIGPIWLLADAYRRVGLRI